MRGFFLFHSYSFWIHVSCSSTRNLLYQCATFLACLFCRGLLTKKGGSCSRAEMLNLLQARNDQIIAKWHTTGNQKWQKANKQKHRRAWTIQRQISKADSSCLRRRGMHWAQYALWRAYRFARTIICKVRLIVPAIIPTATMQSFDEFYAICLSLVQTTACPVNKANLLCVVMAASDALSISTNSRTPITALRFSNKRKSRTFKESYHNKATRQALNAFTALVIWCMARGCQKSLEPWHGIAPSTLLLSILCELEYLFQNQSVILRMNKQWTGSGIIAVDFFNHIFAVR